MKMDTKLKFEIESLYEFMKFNQHFKHNHSKSNFERQLKSIDDAIDKFKKKLSKTKTKAGEFSQQINLLESRKKESIKIYEDSHEQTKYEDEFIEQLENNIAFNEDIDSDNRYNLDYFNAILPLARAIGLTGKPPFDVMNSYDYKPLSPLFQNEYKPTAVNKPLYEKELSEEFLKELEELKNKNEDNKE